MSKWFVGQRVKLVRPVDPACMGREGFISELLEEEYPVGTFTTLDQAFSSIPLNCGVSWDGESFDRAQHTDQLEPVVPDGMKPAEWEDTLWNPNHLFVLENDQSKELVCIA